MRNREFLGQHELMVMLAVLRLGREAYGVPIAAEIAQRTGREMLQGSVYAILERLESKGFVTSRLGEATLQRGGRAKRYFALTAEGAAARCARHSVLSRRSGRALPSRPVRGHDLQARATRCNLAARASRWPLAIRAAHRRSRRAIRGRPLPAPVLAAGGGDSG